MEDLKIRVHTEQQAIIAIELAETLGYKEVLPKSFKLTDGYVCLREKDKAILKVCISQAGLELNEFKEISMLDFSWMTAHAPQHKENLKIAVSNEAESKEAQELLFKMGYVWRSSGKVVTNLDHKYIFLNENKYLTCDLLKSEFDIVDYKEITLQELRTMATPQHKEYLDPRNNYELIEWDGGFMVQEHWIEVPADANFAEYDDMKKEVYFSPIHLPFGHTVWQRNKSKEYLNPTDGYKLILTPAPLADWIEVPKGAGIYVVDNKVKEGRFYKKDDNQLSIFTGTSWIKTQYRIDCFYEQMASCGLIISWQRHTQPEALPFIDDEPKHSHYFKDVSGLEKIDVYRILELYGVTNPCLQHAIKKLLCSGGRGAKDSIQDIQEAIDTLNRRLEMIEECK